MGVIARVEAGTGWVAMPPILAVGLSRFSYPSPADQAITPDRERLTCHTATIVDHRLLDIVATTQHVFQPAGRRTGSYREALPDDPVKAQVKSVRVAEAA